MSIIGKRVQGPTVTLDRRLYLTKEGKVVEEKDPARHTLLGAPGAKVPIDRARAVGLVDDEGNLIQPPAEKDAKADAKARAGDEKKSDAKDGHGHDKK